MLGLANLLTPVQRRLTRCICPTSLLLLPVCFIELADPFPDPDPRKIFFAYNFPLPAHNQTMSIGRQSLTPNPCECHGQVFVRGVEILRT
jgi:hypothetical protein